MDADEYAKRHYEGQQAAKAEQRRRRRSRIPTKEIHLTVGIADHDLEPRRLKRGDCSRAA